MITCELKRHLKGTRPNKRMEVSKEIVHTIDNNLLIWVPFDTMMKTCRWFWLPTSQMHLSLSFCKEALIALPLFAPLLLLLQCWPPLETLSARMTSNCLDEPLWPEAPSSTSKHLVASICQLRAATVACRGSDIYPCM